MTATPELLKIHWPPGCTCCLGMKKFLRKHGMDHVSINAI